MSYTTNDWWKAFRRKVTRWEFDDVRLGADRRKYRKKHGISLRNFAKAIGYSPVYISDLERGRRPWNEQLLFRFEATLDSLIKQKSP